MSLKQKKTRPRSRFLPALALLLTLPAAGLPGGAAAAADFSCADKQVAAQGIRTRDDIRAFVLCAAEYVREMGTEEAYRAFHEDERWRSGAYYLFVDTLDPSGDEVTTLVYPPDPSLEGIPSGNYPDDFGADIHAERYRIIKQAGRGWWYYGWTDFTTGLIEPKASYVAAIDWNGVEALVGAGIYEDDLPGTCHPPVVNAGKLAAEPSEDALKTFVNCAAREVETGGWFGLLQLRRGRRWRDGSIYVFGFDESGNQLFSGNPVRFDRRDTLEWGSDPLSLFSGRDAFKLAMTFGEAYFYYSAVDPATGRMRDKVGFVKRTVAQGAPVLIGAGYYVD